MIVDERRPTLLMYQHYDVQPVDPLNEWKRDPFDPPIEDGKFWGRGCADTKGNLIMQILAVQAWNGVEGRPPINLKFVVEGEEEVGSPHFGSFVRANQDILHADGATIEGGDHLHEGTPKIELGCKGILYVEMTSRTAKVDQHSSYAAIAPNPAWRLIHALMTLRDAKGRIKVPGWYKDARRPTARELRYLQASAFKADALKEFWGVSEFVGGGNDFEVLRRLIYSPTCTICGFVSGYIEQGTKTVNPAVAKAKIDFRLVPNMKQEKQFPEHSAKSPPPPGPLSPGRVRYLRSLSQSDDPGAWQTVSLVSCSVRAGSRSSPWPPQGSRSSCPVRCSR